MQSCQRNVCIVVSFGSSCTSTTRVLHNFCGFQNTIQFQDLFSSVAVCEQWLFCTIPQTEPEHQQYPHNHPSLMNSTLPVSSPLFYLLPMFGEPITTDVLLSAFVCSNLSISRTPCKIDPMLVSNTIPPIMTSSNT